ncbi:MAG: thioredoxin [Planctomycetaceae bacterium]|nr:thioredoxin [Planctomycetaceae bacterium]
MSSRTRCRQLRLFWAGFAWCGIGLLALNGCETPTNPGSPDGKKAKNAEVAVLEVNEGNFDELVVNSSLPVLVDFGAVWCGPCQLMNPVVDELATDFTGKVRIVKIDIDHNPNLAAKFVGGNGIPLLVLFRKGKPIWGLPGFGAGIKQHVTKVLNSVDELPDLDQKTQEAEPENDTKAKPEKAAESTK